ncbi:MAG: PIN domain-containing protein [Prevotella sp.]|nr:PIN domain-containing protein [Prevotella sp.]
MRNAIKEYLSLSDSEKQSLLETATIVFDTNVFLNLYRYSKATREALLDIMTSFKDRLWMPYQVAKEFMKNRPEVILETANKYNSMISDGDKLVQNFAENLRIKSNDSSCEELKKYINHWIDEKKTSNLVVTNCNDDNILTQILDLFDGKVGKDYDETELGKIKKDGKDRYDKKIPPGYKDSKKSTENNDNNTYGDLIYWKQILDYAKAKHVDIILVTSDQKEDWWTIINNQTIGPRAELKKEFNDITAQKFHMYKMERFIQIAGKKGEKSLTGQIFEEINSISAETQLSKKELIELEYKPKTLDELKRELYELKEKNENRYNSIKGFKRLLLSGEITSKQYTQYKQTKDSYWRNRKIIMELEKKIHQLEL